MKLNLDYLKNIKHHKLYKANGRPFANCIIYEYPSDEHGEQVETLHSYNSLICAKIVDENGKDKIILNTSLKNNQLLYCYSRTTSMHRNTFLNVDSKQFKENMKKGVYEMRELWQEKKNDKTNLCDCEKI